ncbi:MAG: IS3 family transposase [Bryobacterales bacterium]|nr:IS3 family transposase [Bryobacterales bacterium]
MGTLSRSTRRNLVQPGHPQASLSLRCRLLGLCRSTLYYRPQAPDPDELALMRRLDELYTAHPFYGSRQMSRHLVREGYAAGRHRVRRLMRTMGLEAMKCLRFRGHLNRAPWRSWPACTRAAAHQTVHRTVGTSV